MNYGCLVSIIVPVYNVKEYLAEALDSVLNQTYQNLEIIVVDDGSTDGSGDICDEYAQKDARIKVIHQENQGLGDARNTGLNLMSGEVVAFLDSDDVFQADFINDMMDSLIRKKADLVVCQYNVLNETSLIRRIRCGSRLPRAKRGSYCSKDCLCLLAEGKINVSVWNKLYRRELWKDVRFPSGRTYEDLPVAFQIIEGCNNICVIDKSLYFYRRRSESITCSPTWERISDYLWGADCFDSYVEEHVSEIFNKKHLNSKKMECLNWLVKLYLHYSSYELGQGGITRGKLFQLIGETERKVGIKNCGFSTRLLYFVVKTHSAFM